MAHRGGPDQLRLSISVTAAYNFESVQPPECPVCRNPRCTLRTHQDFARRHHLTPISTSVVRSLGPTDGHVPGPSQITLQHHHPVVPHQIENPRTDPFAQYPVQLRPEDRRLLDIWTQEWDRTHTGPSRHLFPVSVIEMVYPYAIKSPVLFRATLALAATQWALAGGHLDDLSYQQHLEAVQLHSAACQDDRLANSDENILAGICIMSIHMAQGNVLAARRHMQGINTLITSRGGPHYLGMRGIVAGYAMYADHAQSVFHMQKPVWEMPLPGLQFPPVVPRIFGAGFERLRHTKLDQRVLDLAERCCRLTELFHYGFRGQAPRQGLNRIGYLSMLCEYMLADSIHHYRERESLEMCVCLALLIFDHVILRNVGAINPGIRMMESRFWMVMKKANELGLWTDSENVCLYIWALLTALSITIRAESPWQDYAAGEIREARNKAGLHSFEDLRTRALDPFCWLDVAQEATFRKLWSRL